jgi:phosphoribosylaminoimidazole-succinocarboxamide synthase
VRDVYHLEGGYLLMVASDRLSAFDVILPRPIPYKGQVLNQMAFQFLSDTRHIVPNWALECPFANATFGLACTPIRVEMVVRGYLARRLARR